MSDPAALGWVAVDAPGRKPNRTTPRQTWRYGILAAAAVLLAACALSVAETSLPDESRSGSGASEWLRRVVLNEPPASASVNPLDVMAGTRITR